MADPDALVLTAIGIGTAFVVLVLLLVTVLIIRLISWAMDKYTGNGDETPLPSTDPLIDPEASSENRNRARAAAIAVTALIETQPHLSRREQDST